MARTLGIIEPELTETLTIRVTPEMYASIEEMRKRRRKGKNVLTKADIVRSALSKYLEEEDDLITSRASFSAGINQTLQQMDKHVVGLLKEVQESHDQPRESSRIDTQLELITYLCGALMVMNTTCISGISRLTQSEARLNPTDIIDTAIKRGVANIGSIASKVNDAKGTSSDA